MFLFIFFFFFFKQKTAYEISACLVGSEMCIRDRPSEQYPLLMSTGRHESAFRISENRQNPYLLELAPRAYLYINPATAEQLGISDGMRVRVQSSAGSAFAYARFTFGMAQGVVQGVSGWWGEYNINKTVPWDGFAQGMVCLLYTSDAADE